MCQNCWRKRREKKIGSKLTAPYWEYWENGMRYEDPKKQVQYSILISRDLRLQIQKLRKKTGFTNSQLIKIAFEKSKMLKL